MIRIIVFVVAVVVVALFLTGNLGGGPLGPSTSVTLADLHAEPGHWDGKQVTVTGQVGDRVAVLGYGGLKLADGTGNEILVVGATTPAAPGLMMTVEGKFLTAFAIGDLTLPVIMISGR